MVDVTLRALSDGEMTDYRISIKAHVYACVRMREFVFSANTIYSPPSEDILIKHLLYFVMVLNVSCCYDEMPYCF